MRNLSQDEISEKLGVKRSSYAEWEKETIPRADIFLNIAAVLKIDPLDLADENWEPDEKSSWSQYGGDRRRKKISLETIQRDLDNILHHQVWTRAEVRAYGQYPISRDAEGDREQVAKILEEIGRLAAAHAGSIARESILPNGGR